MYYYLTIGPFEILLRIGIVLATSIIFGIVFLTYLRFRNRKMLLISAGFGTHVLYALITLPEIYNQGIHIDENLHLLIHLIALVFILLGILED